MALVSDLSEAAKHTGDVVSAGVVIGTLFNVLPSIAAVLTIIWTALRIWETILNIRAKRAGRHE